MTTEGRPFIGHDNTYEKQRKCRMQDAIDDYLQDDKVSARQTYEEMLSCINDVIQYHEKAYCRARGLYDLMQGNREVDHVADAVEAAGGGGVNASDEGPICLDD